MRRLLLPLGLALLALIVSSGCASVEPKDFRALQTQVQRNQMEIRRLSREFEASRRPQADMVAEVESLRQELARVRGQVEETSHQLGRMPRSVESMQQKSLAKQAELESRLARLEAYLGIKAGSAPPAKPGPGRTPAPSPALKAKPRPKPASPKPKTAAQVYELGIRLYKKKSYQAARDRFQEVLRRFPKSKLGANARYWIGQTYFAQKKYEEAILAYNQVIKRYPRSGKVPSALLKQGLAFARLGDKRTAKIVLKKLIRNHPKTKQAATARRVLKKMK